MSDSVPFFRLPDAVPIDPQGLQAWLARTKSAPASPPVVRVEGVDVPWTEVRAELERIDPAERKALSEKPGALAIRLRLLLAERFALREAVEAKWNEDPRRLPQLREVWGRLLTELYLQAVSVPPDGYPGDDEVRARYEAEKEALVVPDHVRLAGVTVIHGEGASADVVNAVRAQASAIRTLLAEPGFDFPAISGAPSARGPGRLAAVDSGWVPVGKIPGWVFGGLALNGGALSELLQVERGWQVLKVRQKLPAHLPPLAAVRATLVQSLRQERARKSREAYLVSLLERNPVSIDEAALAEALKQGAATGVP